MVKVVVEIILFWVVVIAGFIALWRFARQYRMTALICPHCGEATPLARSKPDIYCRNCRRPLQLKGELQEQVTTRTFPLFAQAHHTGNDDF